MLLTQYFCCFSLWLLMCSTLLQNGSALVEFNTLDCMLHCCCQSRKIVKLEGPAESEYLCLVNI